MSTAQKASAAIASLPNRNAARSEATKVEQSRAVAEVKAMVVVAQQVPRNEGTCRLAMQASCAQLGLAERAFFSYDRAGSNVTGPSIHLAVDLARCWGNVNYGVKEMSRDDDAGSSEMLAYAWDLQTNARSETTFIVPHKRDKRGGPVALTDMRDIYENNANMGARRLREMIFRILPPWYVEEAKDLCHKALESDAAESPAEKKKAMLEAYAALGISVARLEAKVGSKVSLWTPLNMAQLKVSYGSISRREASADEEFPTVTSEAASNAIAAVPKTDDKQTAESAGDPTAADASGEAVDATPQPPTSPEAPALDFGEPAGEPPFNVEAAAGAFLSAVEKFTTAKAIDNYMATNAATLEKIRTGYEPAHAHIVKRVEARKKALGR